MAVLASPQTTGVLTFDSFMDNESELVLQRFGIAPILTFSSSAVGVPTTQTLRLTNPNINPLNVDILGDFEKRGFSVQSTSVAVAAQSFALLNLTWTPRDSSATRVQLQLRACGHEGSGKPVKMSLAATLLGSVAATAPVSVKS